MEQSESDDGVEGDEPHPVAGVEGDVPFASASDATRSLEGEGALVAPDHGVAAIESSLGLVAAARRARKAQQVPMPPASAPTEPDRTTFTYNSGRTSAVMHPAFAYTSRDEIARFQREALEGRSPDTDDNDLPDLLQNSKTDDHQGRVRHTRVHQRAPRHHGRGRGHLRAHPRARPTGCRPVALATRPPQSENRLIRAPSGVRCRDEPPRGDDPLLVAFRAELRGLPGAPGHSGCLSHSLSSGWAGAVGCMDPSACRKWQLYVVGAAHAVLLGACGLPMLGWVIGVRRLEVARPRRVLPEPVRSFAC
jgi:hypothetical protein